MSKALTLGGGFVFTRLDRMEKSRKVVGVVTDHASGLRAMSLMSGNEKAASANFRQLWLSTSPQGGFPQGSGEHLVGKSMLSFRNPLAGGGRS